MIKYIISAVVITLFLLADIYIFAVCGEVIGFAMVALETVAVVRLRYELREFNKEGCLPSIFIHRFIYLITPLYLFEYARLDVFNYVRYIVKYFYTSPKAWSENAQKIFLKFVK